MKKLKYSMFIQWSEEDSCFLVAFPDFPEDYWRTHGDTYEENEINKKREKMENIKY